VSRIDEALRRNRGTSEVVSPVAHDQAMFRPAWPVSGAEPTARDRDRDPVEDVAIQDERIKRPVGLAVSHPGVMGFSSAWRERLASTDGNPGLVEQFRRLAATLHHAQQANGLRSLMVTSASPGDGKTLTAVNLALVLAESYRSRVLLIDADLRRPSIPSVVDLGDGAGLSDALRSSTEQKLALVALTPRLTILPAGQPIANSIEALTSPRMQQILAEAGTRYDWVILDAPPVGPTADARLLTQMVGGTVFVVHAGRTQYSVVQKAIEGLGREQILGVVLNGVKPEALDGYYGVPRDEEKS
jgi:protein-tyrosine kinase